MAEQKEKYEGVKYIKDGNYVDPEGNVLGEAPASAMKAENAVATPAPAPSEAAPAEETTAKKK